MSGKIGLVYTIKDLCRVCYTCVRECPVKAEAYEKLLIGDPYKGFINYDCPAIVSFVQKYHPELIGSLVPVVFPMVATVRYIREVHIRKSEQNVEITMEDSGIGMSGEEVSQLFKEFVRIKNSRTLGIDGSGLGLSIASRIAELYGGHIHVESEPDKGSIFSLIMPLS